MNIKASIALTLLALALSGCATNYAKKPAADVAKAVKVKDSEFDSNKTYIGPQAFSETQRGLFTDNQTIQLVAVQDKRSITMSYYVYVRILYSFDWRFYDSVSFTDGTTASTKEISRQVNSCTGMGCIHTEELSFPIDYARLTQSSDLKFRLNSRNGAENTLVLPKKYIEGFIMGVHKSINGG